jgi:hypothetical protein
VSPNDRLKLASVFQHEVIVFVLVLVCGLTSSPRPDRTGYLLLDAAVWSWATPIAGATAASKPSGWCSG